MSTIPEVEKFPVPLAEQRIEEAFGVEVHKLLTVPVPSPAMPDQILLGSLRDGRLRVKAPIVVRFTKENEDVIAEAPDLNEFGFAKNPSEALIDLQAAIAELYFTLERERDRLGPDLQRVWAALQGRIVPRP